MNYPLFLARRLSLASSGDSGRSAPAVKVASAAVALSVAVMLASIAVVTGFKHEITRKVVGFNSDIQLYALPSSEPRGSVVSMNQDLEEMLSGISGVAGSSLQISVPALFKTPEDFKGIYIRSIDDQATRNFIAGNLEEGRLPDKGNQETVISVIAAKRLGLHIGDKIDTYFFSGDIRVRRLTVTGIYNSHFDSYDDVTAYAPLGLLQTLTELEANEGSSIKLNVEDFKRLDETALNVQNALMHGLETGVVTKPFRVATVADSGGAFFQWLALLDTNVVVILSLMVLVGCVTLIGGMLMLILDKRRFIGILKALGMPSGKIRRIFVYLAMRVAAIGMIIGNLLGLGILLAQEKWHFLKLNPDAYYIDFVPVRIDWIQVLILNVAVMVIIYFVLILPSRFVAGISPAETMRGEE